MRNKLTKFLTSECPPKGMRQFAKTWKYAACMLLAFFLGIGNVWADPTGVSAGTYELSSSYKPGSNKRFKSIGTGIYLHRVNNSSWNDTYGMKLKDNQNGVAFYISSAMNVTFRYYKNSNSKAETTTFSVYTISASDYALFTGGTENSTNVELTLGAATATKTVELASTYKDYKETDAIALTAGYYYIVGKDDTSNGTTYWTSLTLAAASVTKHTVTYDLNGGGGTTPTQADVAENAKFTLHDGVTGITAPSGQKFDGWHDGSTKYAGGAEYTMGTSNVTLTAQWVENVPDPTASFEDATYIIGQSALDMSAKFTSNSSGSVTYSLKEATSDASITSAGSFTATAAGEYVVVASQAAVTGSYAAISKEATVTVLDNELSDIYIWKKNSSYGGDDKCVSGSAANVDANADKAETTLEYSKLTMVGLTKMGRPAVNETECILTFEIKAAYSADFGIKSICTYGKFEEAAGGQISWDGGTNWEALAAYSDGKKEFTAPAGTFPASFKMRFIGSSSEPGGLWWRNALVTLQVKKTVTGTVEELTNVKVNGVAIDATDLATLKTNKSLAITTTYGTAPTVTFVKQVTTSYSGGWADDVTSVDVEVVASDNTTAWQASATINAQAYTVTLAKPAGPSLETEATAFTLTSAKVATDTKKFTFSGVNLTSGNVTISLESPVAGMTVSPAEVTPTAGAITDQEVTITYKSLEAVAEANVNLVVYYDADTKITIPLTYSSTAGVEDLTPISAATTWNWDGAADAAFGTLGQNDMIVLVNADVTWNASFNASAIAGKLQHYYRDSKYAQGNELKFNTTIPGKVYVTYSNTGGNPARTVNVNGTKGSLTTAGTGEKRTESFAVTAGDVLIKGVLVSDDSNQMLRFYEVRFVPVFAVTYGAGEGSVKGGETMPTQADEAAGEKIILAAATALEKDGYDFAGWLCNIDAQTYQPGDEYEMTAAATTFTAQWVLHVDPVDPTLTYDEGAYTTGGAALDLSSLITAQTSTGAITYSVKEAGTTGATIDGKNFTATAAGTAVITASQAAVLGYNAKEVDFNVVVTEATEIDGIKLVEAGALTGNFITGSSLSNGEYTIEGIHYEKYLKFGSTFSGSYGSGARTNYIFYDLKKENTTFYVYAHNNTSTAGKILVYTYNTASAKYAEVPVAASENAIKSFSLNEIDQNTRVFIGVDNNNIYFCQVVVVESGADLMKAGEIGYEIDFSAKSRFSAASGTAIDLDGMEFVTSSGYTPNSSTEVGLGTIGTNYVKFKLDAPTTVEVKTNSTNQYYIGSTYDADEATSKTYGYKPTSNGETHSFDLTAGTWYLNPNTSNIKLLKLTFTAPKCAEPSFDALANSDICEGDPYVALDGTATITDAGTVTYKWYAEGADESDPAAVLGTNATYTPSANGKYYVIATNQLAGYSDNVKKSDVVTVTKYAGTVISEELVNLRGEKDDVVTLSVVASGKNLHYTWKECATIDGTYTDAGATDAASLDVTITEGLSKYFKVIVHSDCGADKESVAKVEQFVPVVQANVSASTTWNWTEAASVNEIKLTDATTPKKNEGFVMANGAATVYNNANFESDKLYLEGEYIVREGKYFQGQMIKFNTTVAGLVRVKFSHTGNSKPARELYINGVGTGDTRTNATAEWSKYVEVPAGEVSITSYYVDPADGAGIQYIRVPQIEFLAENTARARALTVGNLGTTCIENACIVRGAEIYEIKGRNEIGKIVFDQLGADEVLEAGYPYVMVAKEANIRFFNTTAEPATEPYNAGNGLIGTFEQKEFAAGEASEGLYFFKDHALWAAKETGMTIPAYRCYLDMNAVGSFSGGAPAPGRRRITMDVHGQNAATGIGNVQGDEVQSTKVLINGQLFILRGEKMYDATGRMVK